MNPSTYVITNRQLNTRRRGLSLFGKVPSEKGPNELRIVEVQKRANGQYSAKALTDKLDKRVVNARLTQAGNQVLLSARR